MNVCASECVVCWKIKLNLKGERNWIVIGSINWLLFCFLSLLFFTLCLSTFNAQYFRKEFKQKQRLFAFRQIRLVHFIVTLLVVNAIVYCPPNPLLFKSVQYPSNHFRCHYSIKRSSKIMMMDTVFIEESDPYSPYHTLLYI